MRLLVIILFSTTLSAQSRTKRLIQRLAEEAAAFQTIAPFVLGQETLQQRALKPPPKFRIRVGKAATKPLSPEWQQRAITSEYGFTTFEPNGPLHELRQVISVDGRPVKKSQNISAETLARIILAGAQERKRELVKQFASYGLRGAATDFGQLILLFTPTNILRYEFVYNRTEQLNGAAVDVFDFTQIDGPNPLTFIDRTNSTEALHISGQVWMTSGTYTPIRIMMRAYSGSVQQEATVDYKNSNYDVVLPFETHHRETRDGTLSAENDFSYTNFKRFGASSGLVVEEEDSTNQK